MKKCSLLIVLVVIGSHLFSQQIHSPAEILKIMSDSKLSYEVNVIDKVIECPDYSKKLNYHDSYRVKSDSGLFTYAFKPNDRAKPLFDKAESFFQSNADSALFYYKLTLEADTSLYNVMTYIGQMYESKGDIENTIRWYKTAIGKNYIDYMAHWFLADAYLKTGDSKNAVDEIVIAQILNRNNQNLKKSAANIFKRSYLSTADWYFNPQVELKKVSDSKISLAFNEKWIGYAMAKALWAFEPGYSTSMGVEQGQYSTTEDRECLIALLVSLDNAKTEIKDDPQLSILKEAAENKFLDEYILYEIVLPKTPFVACQLPEETILGIKDYILKVRNK
jgi:hypothetical protein